MLEQLSPLQRHCLAALEVDCFQSRATPAVVTAAASGPTSASAGAPAVVTAAASGPTVASAGAVADVAALLLVAHAGDAATRLVRALASALSATVHLADAERPAGAVLVSIGNAAPDAALSLPALDVLRSEPRTKQRSWLKIRSFLSLRRRTLAS